jgi:hypothetical protein
VVGLGPKGHRLHCLRILDHGGQRFGEKETIKLAGSVSPQLPPAPVDQLLSAATRHIGEGVTGEVEDLVDRGGVCLAGRHGETITRQWS